MKTLENPQSPQPIGIFDSGVGGLTVAAALRRRLPAESLLYLGDVARLPYGTKSPATVTRYALQAAAHLAGRGVKMLVIACNTASAHALDAVTRAHPDIPVLGVVEAGAQAACHASGSGRIVVTATEGTCRSRAFEGAILAHRPQATVSAIPCPLFVALAEEGLIDGPIAQAIARHYLEEAVSPGAANDCLVLGCTHFPLLAPLLRRMVHDGMAIVDCAAAVAEDAARQLDALGMGAPKSQAGGIHLLATDAPDRFLAQARRMVPGLAAHMPELVDLA